MNLEIRPATKDDYPAMAAVQNLATPREKRTPEELAHWYGLSENHGLAYKFVAMLNDDVVGFVFLGTNAFECNIHRLIIRVRVAPAYRNLGIGSKLYDTAMSMVAQILPESLSTQAAEDDHASVHFAKKRGFTEGMRAWESILDTSTLDLTKLNDPRQRLESEGIVFKTLTEISSEPEYLQKLHVLDSDAAADVPSMYPYEPMAFEIFCDLVTKDPSRIDDGFFVAVEGDEYVGVSMLFKHSTNPSALKTGFTGVRRSHRRRGIALALKLTAMRYAKEHGYQHVHTENATINRPMLSINEMLGFQKQPASIIFKKQLREERAQ